VLWADKKLNVTKFYEKRGFKYHKTFSDLVNTRFSVVANDIKWGIERGLKLGINLPDIKNTQQLIDNTKSQDEKIDSITVFALNGSRVEKLFHTNKEEVDVNFDNKVIEHIQTSTKPYWSFNLNGNLYILGITFKDAIGTPIGGLYLKYDRSAEDMEEISEVRALYIRYFAVILVVLMLSALLAYSLMKTLSNNLELMNIAVSNLLEGRSISNEVGHITQADLRTSMGEIERKVKITHKALNRIKKIIDGIK
jgi:hypothetical protein